MYNVVSILYLSVSHVTLSTSCFRSHIFLRIAEMFLFLRDLIVDAKMKISLYLSTFCVRVRCVNGRGNAYAANIVRNAQLSN